MSERLLKCPNCGIIQFHETLVRIHNPKTNDMNMNVTLRCGGMAEAVVWKGQTIQAAHEVVGCGHEWEGQVTSYAHQRERERGYSI